MRERALVSVAGLVGAALASITAGKVWYRTSGHAFTGDDLTDRGAQALALACLAGFALSLLSRRLGQRILGVLIAVLGIGLGWLAIARRVPDAALLHRTLGVSDVEGRGTATPWFVVAGAVLAVAAAVAMVVRSGHWATGTSRFDRQKVTTVRTSIDAWKAIDEGIDPTASEAPGEHPPIEGNLVDSPDAHQQDARQDH